MCSFCAACIAGPVTQIEGKITICCLLERSRLLIIKWSYIWWNCGEANVCQLVFVQAAGAALSLCRVAVERALMLGALCDLLVGWRIVRVNDGKENAHAASCHVSLF